MKTKTLFLAAATVVAAFFCNDVVAQTLPPIKPKAPKKEVKLPEGYINALTAEVWTLNASVFENLDHTGKNLDTVLQTEAAKRPSVAIFNLAGIPASYSAFRSLEPVKPFANEFGHKVELSGYIRLEEDGVHTFMLDSNAMVSGDMTAPFTPEPILIAKVTINGKVVIDYLTYFAQKRRFGATTGGGTIDLKAGWYPVKMELYFTRTMAECIRTHRSRRNAVNSEINFVISVRAPGSRTYRPLTTADFATAAE